MNLTQKQQQLVMVGLVAAMLVVATWLMVLSPQAAKMAENETVVTEYTEKKGKADAMIAKEAQFKADMATVKAKLGEIEDQMAEGDVYLWMSLLLQKFKSKYGFDVDIPSVGRDQRVRIGALPEFPYDAAMFKISGTGHFHDIGTYIKTFENDHPFIRVQNLVMTPVGPTEDGDSAEVLSFSAELVALVKPLEEEEGKESK